MVLLIMRRPFHPPLMKALRARLFRSLIHGAVGNAGHGLMFVKRFFCGIAAMAALSYVAPAATTINVDLNTSDGSFATYSGTAAAPDTGTFWNGFAIGPEAGPVTVGSASGALLTSGEFPSPVT